MELFDFLGNITQKKEFLDFNNEEIEKTYSPFMINRFLSMKIMFIPIIELLNQTKNLSKSAHYRFLYNVIPSGFVKLNYIKKKKSEDLEDSTKQLLMRHFEFGANDLECALQILSSEQVEDILSKYKSGKTR